MSAGGGASLLRMNPDTAAALVQMGDPR